MTEIEHRFTLDIAIDKAGIPAIQWLAENCDLSRQCLKQTMTKGAVWLQRSSSGSSLGSSASNLVDSTVDGRSTETGAIKPIRRASNKLNLGERLFLYYDTRVLQQVPPAPSLLYENSHYSVWNKPSGMLSHGSKWGDHCSITRWVEQHHPARRPSFLIHRLDRAASGIIMLAHNKKSAAALCKLFEQRKIEKRYQAIVKGHFADGVTTIETDVDSKSARTIVRLMEYQPHNDTSLVDVAIETGRKHQIRRHLSELGHAIVGDRLYNDTVITSTTPNLQLRAYILAFDCPLIQQNQSFSLDESQLLQLDRQQQQKS
ncbi:MAG: tRNA pseudouridine32 synthase/23S rRNA pseudouridine746 synthase [Kiritimatiellia bacterium]|jgi:tRNA pseudouridine32 synthase/23S rRNA pseudouridine746 synthase